jgi:alpha-glucoside transport system substrate-binding protein
VRSRRYATALLFVAAALAAVAAGCGGSSKSSSSSSSSGGQSAGSGSTKSSSSGSANASGSISFDGVWTGAEAKNFAAVISAFNKQYPKVHVKYKPVGDNLPQVVSTAVAGGHPPDMADVAQPGLVKQFVDKGALKPLEYARSSMKSNFAPAWLQLGTFNGKLYGIVFKASNKSTVWYNAHAFKSAGVNPPSSWPQFVKAANTVKASGTAPFSIGGSDGWTLTDLFENIYLRQAGPTKYNQLSAHKIKWTDPSVKQALKTMGQVLQGGNMAGGTSGAIQTDFPTSVNNVFQNPPKAAMVIEGDFVPGVATVKAKAGTDYGEFPFPSINGSGPAVEIGGDTIVAFRDNPAIEAFVKFLTTADAAKAWASKGGFATGNKNMPSSVYPDAITRKTASAIAQAKNVVFDMSDQQPGSFGATVGQGEWGLFQDFLRNPSNVNGIAQKLESAATAAYKKGK